MFFRGILSGLAIAAYWLINSVINPVSTIASGVLAGKQFDNSNVSYVESSVGISWLSGANVPCVILLAVLAFIWWGFFKKLGTKTTVGTLLLTMLMSSTNAYAYYSKEDYSEAYFILPNESAFFIPDVGANKDSQVKFGSADYLEANKIAAKRFTVPHNKFSGSGLWSDFFVPTGRLIIVDRTPYNREWVAPSDRGTSQRNESFPCQSSDGINITAEVGIAASVTEENASKFLYFFGVKPPKGDRADPNVVFTSVYYGRNLAEVMDSVGRGKIQALVCHEIGSRTFDKANTDINAIMDAVEKNTSAFLLSRGITLDYIGWAGTFSFDKDVQQAVNDLYTAEKIAPVLETLKSKAMIDTIQKWNGAMPNTLATFGSSFFDNISNWMKAAPVKQ